MIGGVRSGPVPRSAASGHCTYAFTPCKPPVSTLIARDKSTAIGVCESLSAHWVKYLADAGSMWNWLMSNGQISMAKLQYDIVQLQRVCILGDQDSDSRSHGRCGVLQQALRGGQVRCTRYGTLGCARHHVFRPALRRVLTLARLRTDRN